MQCGAKMNMVTFSAFEKQICNILHLLHISGFVQVPTTAHAESKTLPRGPQNPHETPPREPPSSPRIKHRNAQTSVLKTLWSLPLESSTGITYRLNTYD